jgi:hypothetical protein
VVVKRKFLYQHRHQCGANKEEAFTACLTRVLTSKLMATAQPARRGSRMTLHCSDQNEQTEENSDPHAHGGQLFVMSSTIGRLSWHFSMPNNQSPHSIDSRVLTRASPRDSMLYHLSSSRGFVYVLEEFKAALPVQPGADTIRTFAELLTCGLVHLRYEGAGGKFLHACDCEKY